MGSGWGIASPQHFNQKEKWPQRPRAHTNGDANRHKHATLAEYMRWRTAVASP